MYNCTFKDNSAIYYISFAIYESAANLAPSCSFGTLFMNCVSVKTSISLPLLGTLSVEICNYLSLICILTRTFSGVFFYINKTVFGQSVSCFLGCMISVPVFNFVYERWSVNFSILSIFSILLSSNQFLDILV